MSYDRELKAFEAFRKLTALVDECRALFDDAGMEYPPSLKRLLGIGISDPDSQTERRPHVKIEPPTASRPTGIPADWINVPVGDASINTLVLAHLRQAQSPVRARELQSFAEDRGISPGAVANAGKPLEDAGVIRRNEDGWSLKDPSRAPIVNGKYVWGDPAQFNRSEIAARRREAIEHVLRHFPEGLQALQILARLQESDWLKTPANKDLIKTDIEEMRQANKLRRLGQSGKWTLVE